MIYRVTHFVVRYGEASTRLMYEGPSWVISRAVFFLTALLFLQSVDAVVINAVHAKGGEL